MHRTLATFQHFKMSQSNKFLLDNNNRHKKIICVSENIWLEL